MNKEGIIYYSRRNKEREGPLAPNNIPIAYIRRLRYGTTIYITCVHFVLPIIRKLLPVHTYSTGTPEGSSQRSKT